MSKKQAKVNQAIRGDFRGDSFTSFGFIWLILVAKMVAGTIDLNCQTSPEPYTPGYSLGDATINMRTLPRP